MAKFDRIFSDTGVKKPEPHPKRETKWIHYTKLVDNRGQYCDERDKGEIEALADIIDADRGILQNLLVRKTDTDEFEIIAGHKRRRAVRCLVEERGKKQYEFLPCTIQNLSDVLAEFQLYSSNRFHEKNEYEKMHELERMKYLLENYPEEFPHLQTGRMVERLSRQMNMKRTTVGEYLQISKNLGTKGKEEFKKGSLKKSAAVEMSVLSEKEQEELIEQKVFQQKDIKAYKEAKKEKTLNREKAEAKTEMVRQEQDRLGQEEIQGQYRIINTDMEIEAGSEKTESQTEQPVQAGFPILKNDEQRKAWIQDYEAWGVWYKDDHIGAVYYKYDFPDGTRLIAETYGESYSMPWLHLVGGPKEREVTAYGVPEYPYHEKYSRHSDSVTEIVTFLKKIQKR